MGRFGSGSTRDTRVIARVANHACRRVEEVLKGLGPDLDLILDLAKDPQLVAKTVWQW